MIGNGPVSPKSDPVANEILNRLSRLADQASEVAGRASEQLHPICREDLPCDEKCGATAIEREYPPLFNDMRAGLNNIESALRRLTNILDRCEV